MDSNRTATKQSKTRRKPHRLTSRQQQPGRVRGSIPTHELDNPQPAELLARKAENTHPPLTRAFRRASRRAFLWPEEASSLQKVGRSLTELQGIGPHLAKKDPTWF